MGPWMWADAIKLLEQADRLQKQFFHTSGHGGPPQWEPPVDIYERSDGLLIEIALPGVSPDDVRLEIVDGVVVLRAQRRLLQCKGGAQIRRLEIPYGLFERRLQLPAGIWAVVGQEYANGCLRLLLARR
jgi:HSP20 family molecular chaperone IbpA